MKSLATKISVLMSSESKQLVLNIMSVYMVLYSFKQGYSTAQTSSTTLIKFDKCHNPKCFSVF